MRTHHEGYSVGGQVSDVVELKAERNRNTARADEEASKPTAERNRTGCILSWAKKQPDFSVQHVQSDDEIRCRQVAIERCDMDP